MTEQEKNYSFLSSFVKGESITGVITLPTKVFAGLSGLIVITHLSIFQYGVYVLIFALYALLHQFSFRLLSNVILNDIVRFVGEKREDAAKRLFIENTVVRAVMAIFLFIALFLGADVVASFYDKDIATLFRIFSFLFISDALRVTMVMLFRVRLRFDLTAYRHLLLQVIRFVLLLGSLLFFAFSAQLAVLIYVIASFLSLLVLVMPFFRLYKPWREVHATSKPQLIPIIRSHGKWPLAGQSISGITGNLQPWLIKFFINTEAVAIYSVAESMYSVLKLAIPTSTLASLIPREVSNKERLTAILLRGVKFSFLLRIGISIIGFLTLPIIILFFLPQYTASVLLFQVLVITLPIMSFYDFGKKFLVVLRRQRYIFMLVVVNIIGTLSLTLVLLYFFGLWGMVFERVVMAVVMSTLTLGYLIRHEVPKNQLRVLYTLDKTDYGLIKKILSQLREHTVDAVKIKFLR